uniref:Ribonucleases P/MRP protein subunit POP1 isoform X2 n=1 Tax=Petromyzon marinus TaxID=7757 RepID=A0AAJ7WUQ2_PETMA|nr:ribonucleases P/MRP protein subunit POP1 isoform X2 [Petromyzon marinus]
MEGRSRGAGAQGRGGGRRQAKKRERIMRHQPKNVVFPAVEGGAADERKDDNGGISFPAAVAPFTPWCQEQEHSVDAGPEGAQRQDTDKSWALGLQQLPDVLTAESMAQARAAEMLAMLQAVKRKSSVRRVFQTLPTHMRRRAMSHNVKRLPRCLRDAAKREVRRLAARDPLATFTRTPPMDESSAKAKVVPKCRSRKARRRHGSLLLDYNRRQRRHVWLETHVWHAKRFRVAERWGYRLGLQPTTKTYRSAYRAMAQRCLLQDVSYYCCLELKGKQEVLLGVLSTLCSPETGTYFDGVDYLSGQRQGSLVMYRANGFPTQPLGPVTFLWRPLQKPDEREMNTEHRQLWIWVHPAMKNEVLSELKENFKCLEPVLEPPDLKVAPPTQTPGVTGPAEGTRSSAEASGIQAASAPQRAQLGETSAARKSEMKAALPEAARGARRGKASGTRKRRAEDGEQQQPGAPPAKRIYGDGTRGPHEPRSWSSVSTGTVLTDLTMEMVRFQLIGPRSGFILTHALRPADVHHSEGQGKTSWWLKVCSEPSHVLQHENQGQIFQLLAGLGSASDVPPGCVLGLTVGDPRLDLPNKRTIPVDPSIPPASGGAAACNNEANVLARSLQEGHAQSWIWDRSVRDEVTETKIPEQELNRMRHKALVPGSRLNLGARESSIPALLLQHPGRQAGAGLAGWGVAWDLVLPKAWGMAFWIPLVYRGVVVGGLREAERHSQYQGAPHFPRDFPDCPAGSRHDAESKEAAIAKFKRYPPAKRPNYVKLAMPTPFHFPWELLVHEWELMGTESSVEDEEKPEAESVMEMESPSIDPNHGASFLGQTKSELTEEASEGEAEETRETSKVSGKEQRAEVRGGGTAGEEITAGELVSVDGEPSSERVEPGCETGDGRDRVEQEQKMELPSEVTSEPFYVIRSTSVLTQLAHWCRSLPPATGAALAQQPLTTALTLAMSRGHPRALLWVRVDPLQRGSPEPHATVAVPDPADLDLLRRNPAFTGPLEPRRRDAFRLTRAERRAVGLSRRKRRLSGGGTEGGGEDRGGDGGVDDDVADVSKKADWILGLYPEPVGSMASACSRPTLGFLTQGDFSMAVGHGRGFGFVSLAGLLRTLLQQQLLQQDKAASLPSPPHTSQPRGVLLLTRNVNSLQYRFVRVSIDV